MNLYVMTQDQFNAVQYILAVIIRGEPAALSESDTAGIGEFGLIELPESFLSRS